MRLSANARTGNKTLLTSWRSSSDPSVGNFSAGINPFGIPEFFIWYNGHPFWRSGPWGGQNFIGIPGMSTSVYLFGFTLQNEGDGTFTLSSIQDPAYRLTYVLTSHGRLTEQYWDYGKGDNKRNMKVIISLSVIVGAIAFFIFVFVSWKWMAKHRGNMLRLISLLDF
ncbi:hypothetical protein Peur_024341 [Populus x canadensis]